MTLLPRMGTTATAFLGSHHIGERGSEDSLGKSPGMSQGCGNVLARFSHRWPFSLESGSVALWLLLRQAPVGCG